MIIEQRATCTFTRREDGILEFVFLTSNRRAVDDFLELVELADTDITDMEYSRTIVDIRRSGIPPIAYLSSRMKGYMQQQHHRPPSRTAIIYQSSGLLALLDSVIQLLARRDMDEVRFFQDDETARNWLLMR